MATATAGGQQVLHVHQVVEARRHPHRARPHVAGVARHGVVQLDDDVVVSNGSDVHHHQPSLTHGITSSMIDGCVAVDGDEKKENVRKNQTIFVTRSVVL